MLDAGTDVDALQRVQGRASGRVADGRLRDLHQAGSAKLIVPRVHGRAPEFVFLNTAGGVTGGDVLDYELVVDSGAAVATTQTAERAYRSLGPAGRVRVHLRVGAGAKLAWLPQELILFEGASLERDLRVDLDPGAEVTVLETLVLGRAAMGERLRNIRLRDRREVWRGDTPVLVEAIHLDAADLQSDNPAGLDGAVAVATLSLLAEDAADRLGALRAVLGAVPAPVRAAASAWEGRLTARFLSPVAFPLRNAVAAAVECVTRAPLPRVWQT